MRVAIVAEWYPSAFDPVHGVWAHRQALAARDAGAEVRVLAMRRPVPPLAVLRRGELSRWLEALHQTFAPTLIDGLSVEAVPLLAPPRPWSYGAWGHWAAPSLSLALSRLRRRWPYDVIHAHSLVPPGFAAAWWRRRAGGERPPALVVSTHGPDVIHVPRRSALARRATERVLHEAEVVIANSRWAARRCEELGGRPLRTQIVHFGTEIPAQPQARHSRVTAVTVAHLQARKRHAVVLHALAEIEPQRRPDYIIIGDGPGRAPLESLARDLGLASQVRFLGQLAHDQALAEAWRCHLYVMPSVEEPFGVAYIEAMAGGLPAIGARGEGGPEDIAAAGDGLLLVDVDDHRALSQEIERLATRPEVLGPLGAAARDTVVRGFTWRRCGEDTVAAYRSALSALEPLPDRENR